MSLAGLEEADSEGPAWEGQLNGCEGPFGPPLPQALMVVFPMLWAVTPGRGLGLEGAEQGPWVARRALLGNGVAGVGQGHQMRQPKATGRLLHQPRRGLRPASPGAPATWGGGVLLPMLETGQLFKVKSLWENQDCPASSSWPESPPAPKPLWGQGQLRGGGCRR